MSAIVNVQYRTQAATLLERTAAAVGYNNTGADNQRWLFIVTGKAFYIRNVATETFARAYSGNQHVPVIGHIGLYPWTVREIGKAYQIVTMDGEHVWRLIGGEDYAGIVLQPLPYSGDDSLWIGERTIVK